MRAPNWLLPAFFLAGLLAGPAVAQHGSDARSPAGDEDLILDVSKAGGQFDTPQQRALDSRARDFEAQRRREQEERAGRLERIDDYIYGGPGRRDSLFGERD